MVETTTTTVMTTRITSIEEGTHLRLKTERMVVDSDILAWRDGRTYSYDTVPWYRMSGGLFVSSRFLPLRVWSFDNCCLMVICYIINNYETIAYF